MMKIRAWSWLFVWCVALGLNAPPAQAQAMLTLDVPPGKWKTLRLRNLPKSAVVAIDVQTDAPVEVAFMDSSNFKRYPSPDRPLFVGHVEKALSFSVTTPTADHYFVVFDNRSGSEPRAIKATVRAARGGERGGTTEALDTFENQLNQLFIFEPFPISAKRCGVPTAFSGPSGIVLCVEYARKLQETLDDKAKAADALLFTLFHELGHVLLKQWKYPSYDNEEVADEFATVLMVMLGQKERVRAKAEFFSKNPSVTESIERSFRDDRHPLSVQRARNIIRWANNPQLAGKWQPIFVPQMQTALLLRLQRHPTAWTDRALVDKELAARR